MTRALVLSTAIACAVGLLACDDMTTSGRCAEIEHILLARGEQLPRDCVADTDCAVVEVRPGRASVSSAPYEVTEEVLVLRAEYEAQCGDFNRTYRSAVTSCQPFGQLGRCEVSVQSAQRDLDLGADTEADVSCECVSDGECGPSAPTCNGCLCRDECGLACDAVRACGLIRTLGLGQNTDDCVTRCQQLVVTDPVRGDALRSCLAAANSCGGLDDCL